MFYILIGDIGFVIGRVLFKPVRGELFPPKTSEFPSIIPVCKQGRKVAQCAPSPSPLFIPSEAYRSLDKTLVIGVISLTEKCLNARSSVYRY
jgi:hypothetical protein